jgi:hypothetical protein
MRAAHLLQDGEPKIFGDTLAQWLLGLPDEEIIRRRSFLPMSTSIWILRARDTPKIDSPTRLRTASRSTDPGRWPRYVCVPSAEPRFIVERV